VLQYILVVLTHTAGYKTYDSDDVPAEIRPPATACSRSCSGGHGAARHDDQWEHRRLAKSEDEQRWTGTFFSTHYSDGSDAATAPNAASHRLRTNPPPTHEIDEQGGMAAPETSRSGLGGAPCGACSRVELMCVRRYCSIVGTPCF
jgi:hypothetical protein